jgi:hypothetical protein
MIARHHLIGCTSYNLTSGEGEIEREANRERLVDGERVALPREFKRKNVHFTQQIAVVMM